MSAPAAAQRASQRLTSVFAALILVSLAVAVGSRGSLLLALGAALLALFLSPVASYFLPVFFCALLGLVALMSEVPAPGLLFRIYGSDAMLYFLVLGVIAWLQELRRPKDERFERPPAETWILGLVVAMALFGTLPSIKGLFIKHFDANDVLGDVRRLYVYSFAIAIPLLLPFGARPRGLLKYAIVIGAILVMLTGAVRLATGEYWHTENYTETDYDPRLLSSTDTVTLELGLAYLAALAVSSGAWLKRAAAGALALGCAAFIVLSGWRLAVIFIALSPAISAHLIARLQGRRVATALKLAVALTLLVVFTVMVLAALAPDEFARLNYKYQERVNSFDLGHDQRIWAWKRAFELWVDEPIIGAGLGQELLLYMRTSGGDFIGTVSTAHNVFMIVLYKTGAIGLLLFLLIHGSFVVSFFKRMRNIAPAHQVVAVSLFAGYVSSMCTHSLEPFETAGINSLYLSMGFILLLLRGDGDGAYNPATDAVRSVDSPPALVEKG